ncbi:hypothetical protein [Kribbella deserti]|uniref:Uncharacterized protein n=1 Tax=Kribbella deserti TaxID=1926257 RepID=A0ABV6QFD9_9ACTN
MGDDNSADDARISALFHHSTALAEPDVRALIQGGIDRGRARRRRGAVLAAAAAVGVVALATSVMSDPGSTGGEPGVVGAPSSTRLAAPTTTAQPTMTLPTSKPHQPPKIPKADIPVEAADLPRLFAKLYPGQITSAEAGSGRIIDNGKAGQIAHFRWNGFVTTVGFVAYSGTPEQRCRAVQQDASQSGLPPVNCSKRPDGSILVEARQTAPAIDGGVTSQAVTLFTNHGYEIFIQSYNAGRLRGPVLAPKPPFALTQLVDAVTSRTWY